MKIPPTIAIVPVKGLSEAKSRLSAVLSPEGRRRLVLAMHGDVLAALAASQAVSRTVVVTSDRDVAAATRAAGAAIIDEETPTSLNGALHTALHLVQRDLVQRGRGDGSARCLILPADVPLVTPVEIAELLVDTPSATPGAGHRVVIAPSHDGCGTNALLLMDPDIMGPSFGVDSFARHLALAEALHLAPRVVRMPGLGFDIDTPADLRRLSAVDRYSWLRDAWLDSIPQVRAATHLPA